MRKKDPLLTTDDCRAKQRYKYSDFYCCSRCHGHKNKKRATKRLRHAVKQLLRKGEYD